MATPATYTNPTKEAKHLSDEKAAEAYEQGQDADLSSTQETYTSPNADLEKGVQSEAASTRSDDRTLGDAPAQEEQRDPDIVDWDGPDDPQNPMNWSEGRKWGLIACLGAVTLVT